MRQKLVTRVVSLATVALLIGPAADRGRTGETVREPAADGTVSVVVSPPAEGRGDPGPGGVATAVLARVLEPFDAATAA
ncbi:MAG: hypothetical protein EBX36_06235, partial [Planctomycetia bacterium]|nr:hypothetical protein [Planctomycetia bacterium]